MILCTLSDSLIRPSFLDERIFLFSSLIGTKKKFSREALKSRQSIKLPFCHFPRSHHSTSTLSHLTGLLFSNLRDVLRAQFFFFFFLPLFSFFLSLFLLPFLRMKERRREWNGSWLDARIEQSEDLSQQLDMLIVQKYSPLF